MPSAQVFEPVIPNIRNRRIDFHNDVGLALFVYTQCLFLSFHYNGDDKTAKLRAYLAATIDQVSSDHRARQMLINLLIELIEEDVGLLKIEKREARLKTLHIFLPAEQFDPLCLANYNDLKQKETKFPGLLIDINNNWVIHLFCCHTSTQDMSTQRLRLGFTTSFSITGGQCISGVFYELTNEKKAAALLLRLLGPNSRFTSSPVVQPDDVSQLLMDEMHWWETCLRRENLVNVSESLNRTWLNEEQNRAVNAFIRMRFNRVSTMTGTPGAGKTNVISEMAQELVRDGNRVVIASTSYTPLFHVAVLLNDLLGGRQHILLHNPNVVTPPNIRTLPYRQPDYSGSLGFEDYRSDCLAQIQSHNITLTTILSLTYVFAAYAELEENRRDQIRQSNRPHFHRSNEPQSKPVALIIDESSKLSVTDFLFVIYQAKRSHIPLKICLVGDGAQLQPFSAGQGSRLRINESVFKLLVDIPDIPSVFLGRIYRFRDPLLRVVSDNYYQGRLFSAHQTDGDSQSCTGLVRLEHEGGEVFNGALRSYENPIEANLIIRHIHEHCASLSDNTTYAILAPYNAQRILLAQLLSTSRIPNTLKERIKVLTIDSCQGAEYDVVYISITRQCTSDFSEEIHRMNVALTRARIKCVVVVNKSFEAQTPQFRAVLAAASPDVDTRCHLTFPNLGS
jgi:hypothetical protein